MTAQLCKFASWLNHDKKSRTFTRFQVWAHKQFMKLDPVHDRKWYHPLQWRHKGIDSVSNHQPRECLLNHLIRCRSKKTSKLRATGLCAGNSPETSEFPAQRASNAENVSIWWRHHYPPDAARNYSCCHSTRAKSHLSVWLAVDHGSHLRVRVAVSITVQTNELGCRGIRVLKNDGRHIISGEPYKQFTQITMRIRIVHI